MKLKAIAQTVSLSALGLAMAIPAQAAFIEDSKASLELRNFYMNKDFRNTKSDNTAEEWAQGFLFRYESGYTEGTVGVGVDVHGFAGLKLNSGGGRNNPGTGLLPTRASADKANGIYKSPHGSYGRAGATFKAKLSESTLKAGSLTPKLPTVQSHDGRLLPVMFQGVHLNSQEVEGLTVDLGRLGRAAQRNSTDSEPLGISVAQGVGVNGGKYYGRKGTDGKTPHARVKSTRTNAGKSSKFDFAGISYKWWDTGLTTSYNAAKLHDVYKQHILNGVYTLPIADNQALTADLRYARTSESAKSGIDNKAVSGIVSYKLGHNNFAVAYQKMSGDTGYTYLAGSDPFLPNFVQIRDFAAKDEKSWQARYIHDFASIGIPGLTLMARYIKGTNIDMGAGNKRGREWERDTDIGYVFQDGALKNLGIKWRNATVRNNMKAGKIDENRLIVSYTIPLM